MCVVLEKGMKVLYPWIRYFCQFGAEIWGLETLSLLRNIWLRNIWHVFNIPFSVLYRAF